MPEIEHIGEAPFSCSLGSMGACVPILGDVNPALGEMLFIFCFAPFLYQMPLAPKSQFVAEVEGLPAAGNRKFSNEG